MSWISRLMARPSLAASVAPPTVAVRPGHKAGWALIPRSPWDAGWDSATSWFGGMPVLPSGFEWPRDADGRALNFLAQIDLGALEAHRETGARPPAWAQAGALLVFVGDGGVHAIRHIRAADAAHARPATPPDNLPSLRDIGFWSKDSVFPRWPVDPVAFLDDGQERPGAFPPRFSEGIDWISTWGIARKEVDLLLSDIKLQRFHRKQFRRQQAANPTTGPIVDKQRANYDLMGSQEFRRLYRDLFLWRRTAAAADPQAPVDQMALRQLFERRRDLAARMLYTTATRRLRGDWPPFWSSIETEVAKAMRDGNPAAIAPGLRPVIEAKVTDWAGHRLFGQMHHLLHNHEDRSGQDLLIAVHADALIGTRMDHGFGLSVWCPANDLAQGRLDRGQMIQHDPG